MKILSLFSEPHVDPNPYAFTYALAYKAHTAIPLNKLSSAFRLSLIASSVKHLLQLEQYHSCQAVEFGMWTDSKLVLQTVPHRRDLQDCKTKGTLCNT